jgi:hypothetical protein
MDIGGFSSEHRVEFKDTGVLNSPMFYRIHQWNNKETCECYNLAYFGKESDYIYFYARQVMSVGNSNDNNVIFDGQHLRKGFGGEMIG